MGARIWIDDGEHYWENPKNAVYLAAQEVHDQMAREFFSIRGFADATEGREIFAPSHFVPFIADFESDIIWLEEHGRKNEPVLEIPRVRRITPITFYGCMSRLASGLKRAEALRSPIRVQGFHVPYDGDTKGYFK